MKRHSVIEIGSRAVRLLIADLSLTQMDVISSKGEETELYNALSTSSSLDAKITETLNIISRFVQLSKDLKAQSIKIIGTEALRSLPLEHLEKFKKVGQEIHILKRKDEAFYSLLAALRGFTFIRDGDVVLVFDQGAGSIEVSCGSQRNTQAELLDYRSYALGVEPLVQLLEANKGDWTKFKYSLERRIANYAPIDFGKEAKYTVGSGSSITHFAWLAVRNTVEEKYDSRKVHGQRLKVEHLEKYINIFMAAPHKIKKLTNSAEKNNRNNVKGDIAGLIALSLLMKKYGKEELIVSGKGLRYGVLWAMSL